MENEIPKLHDFPGFPWPVQTLDYSLVNQSNLLGPVKD